MLVIRPSRKAFLGMICLAVLFIGLDGYLYYNRASRLAVLQAELDTKQKKLQDSRQIAERLQTVKRRHDDVEVQLSSLEQGVSERSYIPSFLQQLERLGKQNKLTVVSIRPQPAPPPPPPPAAAASGAAAVVKKEPEPYDRMDIEMEVNGSYGNIVRFLDQLTSFPKIVTVKTLQISPVSTSTTQRQVGSPALSARLGTTAFILRAASVKIANIQSFPIVNKMEEHRNEYQ